MANDETEEGAKSPIEETQTETPDEEEEQEQEKAKQQPQQKRFSFYDAQEVGGILGLSRSESPSPPVEEKPNPNRFNFYDPKLIAEADENAPNTHLNFQVQLQLERGDTKQQQKEILTVPETRDKVEDDNIVDSNIDANTDEILRSLQETEDQRKQILQPAASTLSSSLASSTPPMAATITGVDIAASTGVATAHATTTTDDCGSANHNLNIVNTNPYEDSIRTALDLLRKHKVSPPNSPSVGNVIDAVEQVDRYSVNMSDRDRTPKEHDRLLQHRSYDEDDNCVKAVDYVVQEAKWKSKQHKEVIARYANKLEEFKSALSPEDQLQVQLSTSYTQSYDEADGGDDRNESPPLLQEQMRGSDDDKDTSGRQSQSQSQLPNHIHRHIKASLTEDSTGLVSELSQYSHSNYPQRSYQTNLNSPYQQQAIIEEQVQKGVEKVLVAILEANKNRSVASGNSSCDGGSHSNGIAAIDNVSTNSGDNANDTLLKVLHELLPSSRSIDGTSINSHDGGVGFSTATITSKHSASVMSQGSSYANIPSRKSSVVDELLAEVEDNNGEHVDSATREGKISKSNIGLETIPPGSNVARYWMEGDEKKMTEDRGYSDEQEVIEMEPDPIISPTFDESGEDNNLKVTKSADIDTSNEVSDAVDDSLFESETSGECVSRSSDMSDEGDELDTTYDDHDGSYEDDDVESTHGARVLGPLSREAGGTTGVVLDLESDDSPSSTQDERQMGYFSSVANQGSSMLMSGGEQQILDNKRKEEILANYDVVGRTTNIHDEEATELMRTLCAHLLPFGVDQHSAGGQSIPVWDESNPNEPGYRIIRLSKSQLRRVECAFDAMITKLKHNSLDGVEAQFDPNFLRELEEAERLLDDEDNQNTSHVNAGTTVVNVMAKVQQPPLLATNKNEPATCPPHPEFPCVKSAGNGEMGDLEYFQLPIIFKSHVTGFEPTKDMKLEPGNIIAGQYLVECELGSAAFSTAYKCVDFSSEDNDVREEVCLKVIKNTKDFFDQSLDEIKILELLRQTGQCDENYILRVKTFFYYREHLIIVTELLRRNLFEFGKSIIDNDEEPYFTLPRLAYITRQCLIALRFVHNLGLVHSDVKPENILLGSYSRAQIKLIDFGSSCYLTDRQSSYIQSRSYRAPEVVLGLPYDGKIDVWSLGCVVAEMYTGEVTFQNDSIVSMLSRIEAYRGSFPRHMVAQGRQSNRFFTKSGLLYEVVGDSDDEEGASGNRIAPAPDDELSDCDSESEHTEFDVFQPKSTRLSSRLGFDEDLMDGYGDKNTPIERHIEQMFTDFVARLLTIDPDGRPTAEEALNHPYMVYAASLTDDEIKYPSS
ncbi:unnamed protein product [Pseudo-nitzschia multistriata]|uniref:Protein kinase domain-containing protein n=1 Tax=Pseudo-nitzschia multistriata TaxID=183589 RepID=A0A448ZFL1_9STRA|nr:unnamed protein product [Pseudo-nitzschia multistriata]